MTTTRTALAAGLLALAAVATPAAAVDGQDPDGTPGRSDDGGHPVVLGTEERDCVETNSFRLADPAAVAAALPEGWRPNVLPNGRAQTLVLDYACASFSIDGLPARPTSVTWLVATNALGPDGSRRAWTLEIGSDNPLHVQRLRKLGVDADLVPRSATTFTEQPDGTVRLHQEFVDGGTSALAHTRESTAPKPGAPVPSGATFWFATDDGPVSVTYRNSSSPSVPARMTEVYDPASAFRSTYGIADLVNPTSSPSLRLLTGSWTGELRRTGG